MHETRPIESLTAAPFQDNYRARHNRLNDCCRAALGALGSYDSESLDEFTEKIFE